MWKIVCPLEVNPKIRELLLKRFQWSTFLCSLVPLQFITIFVIFMRLDIGHPIECVRKIFNFSLIYTYVKALVVLAFVAAYGMQLYLLDQRLPTCLSSWHKQLIAELPIKLCLLGSLIGMNCASSWLYLNYLDMDMLFMEREYLFVNGIIAAFFYFCAEHGQLGATVWQLSVWRVELYTSPWLRWRYLQYAMQRSYVTVLFVGTLYWRILGDDNITSCQLVWRSWYLATLFTAQMYGIKCIYGRIMRSKLPLTVGIEKLLMRPDSLDEIQLPMDVAVTSSSMHGFQLMAAIDFFNAMDDINQIRMLFSLHGSLRQSAISWQVLRDLLSKRLGQFTCKLKNYLEPTQLVYATPSFTGLRPLMPKLLPTRYWTRRYNDLHPYCVPLRNLQQCNTSLVQLFVNWLIRCLLGLMQPIYKRCFELNCVEYELCCEKPMVWLIQGLVNICLHSPTEDRFGELHKDLEDIFHTFMNLENLMESMKLHQQRNQCQICETLDLLSQTMTFSLNKLLVRFEPDLINIVQDENLRVQLHHRYRRLYR